MAWLFGRPKKDPVKEVEEQPNVREARVQIHRARVLLEIDQTEDVARGRRRKSAQH